MNERNLYTMQQPPELSPRLMFGLMLLFALILAGAVSLGNAILTWAGS